MTEYLLPRHVHFCRRGDAYVFLDLRQDDYTLVNGAAAAALRTLCADVSAGDSTHEPAQALKELLAGGLLTTDPQLGKRVAPTIVQLAMQPLADSDEIPAQAQLTAAHIAGFIVACTKAAALLRWWRIESVVGGVERRKARFAHVALDVAKARHLTATFLRLRSFFPRDQLCLYDSLALIEFLARHRVFPTWVFGVKLEPWYAHCWLQHEQFVFNDGGEETARYTPILAI